MQKQFAVSVALVTTILMSGCTNLEMPQLGSASTGTSQFGTASVSTPQSGSVEMALAKQTVKIYDVIPPNASPLGQLSATTCDGTREVATDKVIALTSQRGGNGITQLSCKEDGISWSCWKSVTCTATALNVPPPPPIRPAPPPTRRNSKKRTAN
jgi:hypothetical protein